MLEPSLILKTWYLILKRFILFQRNRRKEHYYYILIRIIAVTVILSNLTWKLKSLRFYWKIVLCILLRIRNIASKYKDSLRFKIKIIKVLKLENQIHKQMDVFNTQTLFIKSHQQSLKSCVMCTTTRFRVIQHLLL